MFNLYINNFNISINKLKAEDFGESQGVLIKKFESDTDLFKIEPIIFLADPFLFSYNGRLYLFYERQDRWYGIGHICMRFTNDMQVWSDEIDVLKEAFHLSFPYVFEDNGKVYMLPEAGYSGTIRLYEACNDNLSKWKLSKVIIDEKRQWVDSSIIKKGAKYYLFTSVKEKEVFNQYLFVSDSLDGSYKEHPRSPIYTGNDYGRNGGAVFSFNDRLYRPAQICVSSYGEDITLMQIEQLTAEKYSEQVYKDRIYSTAFSDYNFGGHQFNIVSHNKELLMTIDYRVKNYNVIELIRRIKRNFFNR